MGGPVEGQQGIGLLRGQAPVRKVSGLNPGQFPLDLHHLLQVFQGDGVAVHLGHPAQVGGRVVQQGLDLVQGIFLPVQVDLFAGLQVPLIVQQAVLRQNAHQLFRVAAVFLPKSLQQGCVLHRGVAAGLADGRVGRDGRHGKRHCRR